MFTTRYGDPIEPRNFNRYFAARCEAAGVRQITVYDARRTCATLLVDLNLHSRIVMQILRHAQFDLTMEVYASASSAATREALKRLGRAVDGYQSLLYFTAVRVYPGQAWLHMRPGVYPKCARTRRNKPPRSMLRRPSHHT